jgi:hypothetical protein
MYKKPKETEELKKEELKKEEQKDINKVFSSTMATTPLTTSPNSEEEGYKEKHEDKKKEIVIQSKGSKGVYEDKDEDDTFGLKKIKQQQSGSQGIYGEQTTRKEEGSDLKTQMLKILSKMSDKKIEQIIQKYTLKPNKDHKDNLKLKLSEQVLKERREKAIL